MLKLRVLDERNDKTNVNIGEFNFYRGESRKLRVQVYETVDNSPRYVKSGGTVKFIFATSLNPIEKTGTVCEDLSVLEVALTATETADIISGDIVVEITEGTEVRIAKSFALLRKLER